MAYALVVSLKQIIKPLLDSDRSRIQIPNFELKLIYYDLCYLKSFFDQINSLEDNNSVEDLERQIKDVVQNTQDLIEFHVSDLVDSGSVSSISRFSGELVEVKEKFGVIIKVLKAMEDNLTGDQQSPGGFSWNNGVLRLAGLGTARTDIVRDSEIVGLEDEMKRLLRWLVGGYSKLQVISIVGMGGIGKTTLAKAVYFDSLMIEHFDVRLFVEIDLEYELKEVLLHLLLGQLVSKGAEEETIDQLGMHLHKYLWGRRYLVVLDDVWDTRAWTELQMFLPDNENGSRIILTSRNANVARSVSGEEAIIQKRFLNNKESWDLFCKMAFSDMKKCPVEVEEIGKTIVKNMGGLPLGIVVIGRLLSNTDATAKNWMTSVQTTIPTLLKLSYTQLPQHLKACFLYLGLFPPNYTIPTAQLIKLWVAEGFIEPVADKSLEQKAEEYLQDLVSRSLVIVHKLSSTGRIRSCRIHPLLQDLCVSEARQEKVFHIVKEGTTSSRDGTRNQRRLGIQLNNVAPGVLESVSGVRSLVFIFPQHQRPLQPHVLLRFRWLRVLHSLSMRFRKFPNEVVNLVRLRYLAITYDGKLPSSISRLRNLEVLIIHPTQSQTINSNVFLPLEIWKLHKLRHLQCVGFDLPDPSADATGHRNDLYLEQLLTLSGVSARSCTEGVLARMPNLIKLGIRLEATEHAVEMSCFDAVYTNLYLLESFKCAVMNSDIWSEAAFSLISFPFGLRKLTLSGCGLLWGQHMAIISELPFLQVLKLRWHSFCGREWILYEGGFMSLKYLLLEDLDIEHFIVEPAHIPCLEHLLIRRCYKLEEIPSGIGDIPTLRVIEVHDCSNSVIVSARDIKEEQEGLQVRIHSSRDDERDAMTDAAVEFLMENLRQLLLYHVHLIKDAKDQVERLEWDLRLFKSFLKDYTKKHRREDSLRELVCQIRDVIYEAEDIIDAFVTQATESRPKPYFVIASQTPVKLLNIAKEVEKVGAKVRDFLNLGDGGPDESEVPIPRQDDVVGFEDVAEKIIGYIKEESDELDVISIIGMPGLGKIIALSYDKLPFHLRACFLYFGMFPEDSEISAWKLIRMWIAEGFIQPKTGLNLEETAESNLEELINRNLVRVDKRKPDGKVKTCRIHDMLRNFCKFEAGNGRENFLQEMKKTNEGDFDPPISNVATCRRICIHSNISSFLSSKPYGPHVRSFVCFSKEDINLPAEYCSSIPAAFKLLRVLEAKPIKMTKIPSDLYHLVHLRYITLSCTLAILPGAFYKLWNIQTLVVDTTSRTLDVKADIWKLLQLRHLKTNACTVLPKTGKTSKEGEKLQTLSTISPQNCTEDVVEKCRNLKKLGIRGRLSLLLDGKTGSFESVGRLSNLERLKLVNDVFPDPPSEGQLRGLPPPYQFPPKLRILSIADSFLDWSHMSTIGLLENLEVLKLKDYAFKGKNWSVVNGGFRRLEVFHIGRTDLVVWKASAHHFPRLRCLVLQNCKRLQDIPIELSDIPSFQLLDLYRTECAAASAMRIQEKKIQDVTVTFKLSIFPPVNHH